MVENGGRAATAPVLAPVVRAYLRLSSALVLAGVPSAVAVKAFYSPSAIDIAVSLVCGAPAWVLSRRRVFQQLSEADEPPTSETEPRSATSHRLVIRVARLTAFLAVPRQSAPVRCSRMASPARCCGGRRANGSEA